MLYLATTETKTASLSVLKQNSKSYFFEEKKELGASTSNACSI